MDGNPKQFFERKRQWRVIETSLVTLILAGLFVMALSKLVREPSRDAWVAGSFVFAGCVIGSYILYRTVKKDHNFIGLETEPGRLTAILKNGGRESFELNSPIRVSVHLGEYGKKHGPTLVFRQGNQRLTIKPHEYADEAGLQQAMDKLLPAEKKEHGQAVPIKLSEMKKPKVSLSRLSYVIAVAIIAVLIAGKYPGPFRSIRDLYWRFMTLFILLGSPLLVWVLWQAHKMDKERLSQASSAPR